MANKVVIALLLISCIALSQAADCPLTLGTGLCVGENTCAISSTIITTLCTAFGGLNSVLAITIPNTVTTAVTLNLGTGLSIGGITLNNQATAAVNLNLQGTTTIANDVAATGNTVITAASGAAITISGKLNLAAASILNVTGSLTVNGVAYLNGTVSAAAASAVTFANDLTLTATAAANFAGQVTVSGVLYVDGQATFATTSVVTAAKQLYVGAQSTMTVAGRVTVSNAVTINGKLQLAAAAVFAASTDLTIAAQATADVAGNVTVAGATAIYGKLHLAGTYVSSAVQTAWLIATTTKVTIQGSASATASLTGNGGIDANVELSGTVTIAPGNSPGAVFIRGDFTMSATTTLTIEVDSATSYDQLFIGGKFNRNGILAVDLNNYTPNNGQLFTFATHSSENGNFNLARGDSLASAGKIHPKYNPTNTQFQYGSAATVALPLALIALCILGLVF